MKIQLTDKNYFCKNSFAKEHKKPAPKNAQNCICNCEQDSFLKTNKIKLDNKNFIQNLSNKFLNRFNSSQNKAIAFTGSREESHKISKEALIAGTTFLSEPKSAEYEAMVKLVDEAFVYIKDKEAALSIFKNYYESHNFDKDTAIFVLNPQSSKNAAKKIGTSNTYMTEWYAQANGLEDRIITNENINKLQEKINDGKKVAIIVPDDCAITGRSLIVETARSLNQVNFPENKPLEIIFSPMIDSKCAKQAFLAAADFNMQALIETGILNQNDYSIMQEFFEKYGKNTKISLPKEVIEAKRYQDTDYFINLTKENSELAQAIEAILTSNGTRNGFGRPGTSGVMIATPSSDGISLKCPNNNVFGAAPYALALGAKPTTIKRPSQKVGVKKWQSQLEKMLDMLKSYLKWGKMKLW